MVSTVLTVKTIHVTLTLAIMVAVAWCFTQFTCVNVRGGIEEPGATFLFLSKPWLRHHPLSPRQTSFLKWRPCARQPNPSKPILAPPILVTTPPCVSRQLTITLSAFVAVTSLDQDVKMLELTPTLQHQNSFLEKERSACTVIVMLIVLGDTVSANMDLSGTDWIAGWKLSEIRSGHAQFPHVGTVVHASRAYLNVSAASDMLVTTVNPTAHLPSI